jgi:hypothetical protein
VPPARCEARIGQGGTALRGEALVTAANWSDTGTAMTLTGYGLASTTATVTGPSRLGWRHPDETGRSEAEYAAQSTVDLTHQGCRQVADGCLNVGLIEGD